MLQNMYQSDKKSDSHFAKEIKTDYRLKSDSRDSGYCLTSLQE